MSETLESMARLAAEREAAARALTALQTPTTSADSVARRQAENVVQRERDIEADPIARNVPGARMLMDFTDQFATGLGKLGGGVVQAGSDLIGMLGSDRASKFSQELTAGMNAMPPAEGTAGQVGGFAGQIAPFFLAPGTGALGNAGIGLGAGLTMPQESLDPGNRMVDRLASGVVGAGLGGGMTALGDFAVKAGNSREIGRRLEQAQADYAAVDPAIANARGNLNSQVDRLRAGFDRRGQDVLRAGDSLGPVDMSSIETQLQDKLLTTKQMVNPDKRSVEVLRKTVETLSPQRDFPDVLTVGGTKFSRDPTGAYVSPSGGTLAPDAVKQILAAQGVNPAPNITYSGLKGTIEEIDNFLKKAPAGNAATQALRDTRTLLQTRLEEHGGPGVARLAQNAERFYDKNLKKFDDPRVNKLLTEPGESRRANIAINAAEGGDLEVNKTIAGLVGDKGREAVGQGLIKKAMDAALDHNGQIDAVKFQDYLKKPGMAPYMEGDTGKLVKGIRNLLLESALRARGSPEPSFSSPHGYGRTVAASLGLQQLVEGRPLQAATMIGGAFIVKPTFDKVAQMLGSAFGRNLLVAASEVRPGTPRMSRLMQAAGRRFGPVAAETTADAAAAME
jgi:hypothetical protein